MTKDRALAEAAALDAERAAGGRPGPLAGVTFAVKNLYDVAGLPTIAGSHIDRSRTLAVHDAALVRRLSAAGAILLGALNEDAYEAAGGVEEVAVSENRGMTAFGVRARRQSSLSSLPTIRSASSGK